MMNKLVLAVVVYFLCGLFYGSIESRSALKSMYKASDMVYGLAVFGFMCQSVLTWIIPAIIEVMIFIITKIELKLENEKINAQKEES